MVLVPVQLADFISKEIRVAFVLGKPGCGHFRYLTYWLINHLVEFLFLGLLFFLFVVFLLYTLLSQWELLLNFKITRPRRLFLCCGIFSVPRSIEHYITSKGRFSRHPEIKEVGRWGKKFFCTSCGSNPHLLTSNVAVTTTLPPRHPGSIMTHSVTIGNILETRQARESSFDQMHAKKVLRRWPSLVYLQKAFVMDVHIYTFPSSWMSQTGGQNAFDSVAPICLPLLYHQTRRIKGTLTPLSGAMGQAAHTLK